MKRKMKAASIGILANIILASIKILIGLITSSASVFSEAVNSLMDIIASGITMFSIVESEKKPDRHFNYGYGQVESLSGLFEAVMIGSAGVYILYTAVEKFLHKDFLINQINLDLIVMGVSVLINLFVASYIFRIAKQTDSIALKAKAIDFKMDIFSSSSVLGSLVVIKFTHFYILDPIVAVLLGLIILNTSYKLIVETISRLMDIGLPKEDIRVIKNVLHDFKFQIVSYHSLRTRKSGDIKFIDFHIVVSKEKNIVDTHLISHNIINILQNKLGKDTNVMIFEEPCNEECTNCYVECSIPS